MAWMRPRRSRPGQGMGDGDKSGVAGGSSPPGGGPAALGVGSRVRGDNEMRRLHTISATIGPRSSHPPAVCFADPAVSGLPIRITHRRLSQQRQKELEPGSVGGSRVELDSPGKQCCLIQGSSGQRAPNEPPEPLVAQSEQFAALLRLDRPDVGFWRLNRHSLRHVASSADTLFPRSRTA